MDTRDDTKKISDNLSDSMTDTPEDAIKDTVSSSRDQSDTQLDIIEISDQLTDKIKKLTGALYRVTDLYSDKEPLKWSLRDRAMNIYTSLMSVMQIHLSKQDSKNKISNLFRLEDTVPMQASVLFEEIVISINHIVHSLEIASTGAFVSDLNFDILRKEYLSLLSFLEGKKNDFIFEQKLLIEPTIDSFKSFLNVEKKDINNTKGQKTPNSKGHYLNKKMSVSNTKRQKPTKTKSLNSTERKDKILNFLGKNGKKTVNEIAVNFNGISTKTIQRDLFDLVKNGDLMAEGEKRWRVYSVSI